MHQILLDRLRLITFLIGLSSLLGSALPDQVFARSTAADSTTAPPTDASGPVVSEAGDLPLTVRVGKGGPTVRVAPSSESALLSGLYFDTYLPVLGQLTDSKGLLWYRVTLWGALNGWIRADQTVRGDPPEQSLDAGGSAAANLSALTESEASDISPLVTIGRTREQYNLRAGPSSDSDPVGLIEAGTTVQIRSWQADDSGSAWYNVISGDLDGWIWGGGINLALTDPTATRINGHPISSAITGKGIWLPQPLLEMADPDSIVRAARAVGVTHVYLEAGSSKGGFYGRPGADRFLAAAHRGGLKVIAWVLTEMHSVPEDVGLAVKIATYRTPAGDTFDGIAPDVEFNTYAPDVRTFSEVLRTELGPYELIVGVIFPAGSWTGRTHPVAGILSRSFNALAPMAYWHESHEDFSSDEVYRFISKAVADVQDAVGSTTYPVTIIAQGYDSFGRNGAGPSSPTGAETLGALAGASAGNAIGVSLFQWGTLTPDEWTVFRGYEWNVARRY